MTDLTDKELLAELDQGDDMHKAAAACIRRLNGEVSRWMNEVTPLRIRVGQLERESPGAAADRVLEEVARLSRAMNGSSLFNQPREGQKASE